MWPDVEGAEVRLRFRCAKDQREAAVAAAGELRDRLLAEGAADVKLEPEVIAERRARAPEVAAASGLVAKLEEHWKSVGYEPGARRDALIAKARKLEEETRDGV